MCLNKHRPKISSFPSYDGTIRLDHEFRIERQFILFSVCVEDKAREAQGRPLSSTVRVIYERPRISALWIFNLNKDAVACAYLCPSFEKPLHFHEEQGLGRGKTELLVLQSSWNGNRRWNSTTFEIEITAKKLKKKCKGSYASSIR